MKEIDNIPEIQNSLKNYKAKRASAKSAWNKHSRLLKRFYFIEAIVKPKQFSEGAEGRREDFLLQTAIKDMFNSIGIKSIVPAELADFDVKASFNGYKWGIEVKNGNMPSENDMLQAHKYAMRTDRTLEPVIIWNNATTNQEFDQPRVIDAEKNKYGIITTKELLIGYLKLKQGKITFAEFIGQLKKTGLIKYSLRAMGKIHKDKSKNSEGS